MSGDIIVIGVGNRYRRDDGAGPAVIDRLRRSGHVDANLTISEGQTAELIELWDGARLAVVVDAVRVAPGASAHPGRVHRLAVWQAGGERTRAANSHGIDLGEAVELARALGRLPERLLIFAIEAVDVDHGVGLSPAVQAAVDRLAEGIRVLAWVAARARVEAVA